MLQAQRTETGGPARVTVGVLFQDCGDGTGLACWTGSAFKAAVSSQVKDKVAELKDFLVRLCQTITANDKRIRAKKISSGRTVLIGIHHNSEPWPPSTKPNSTRASVSYASLLSSIRVLISALPS